MGFLSKLNIKHPVFNGTVCKLNGMDLFVRMQKSS